MGLLLDNQKAMADRRRKLADCYICATPLPVRGSPGRWAQVVAEHVLPLSLLGPAPARPADRWPVVLDVHSWCEQTHKKKRDHLAKLLHTMADPDATGWRLEDARFLARNTDVETDELPGAEPVHGITGAGDALLAATLWCRGMYAALYGNSLPSQLAGVVHPPVPVWTVDQGADSGLRADEIREEHILGNLRVATHARQADEIRAWGGAVTYVAAWKPGAMGRGRWGCSWALEFPASRIWARSVRGVDRPWHGYFETDQLPPGALVVGQAEIDSYNRTVAYREKAEARFFLPVTPFGPAKRQRPRR